MWSVTQLRSTLGFFRNVVILFITVLQWPANYFQSIQILKDRYQMGSKTRLVLRANWSHQERYASTTPYHIRMQLKLVILIPEAWICFTLERFRSSTRTSTSFQLRNRSTHVERESPSELSKHTKFQYEVECWATRGVNSYSFWI